MKDREIAYEQNVTGLEKAWSGRIASFAAEAVRSLDAAHDEENPELRHEASELVSARLLKSERWENVTAADISDIAYEAVSRELDSRR